jgi:molybdopterin converting factor subunit 1
MDLIVERLLCSFGFVFLLLCHCPPHVDRMATDSKHAPSISSVSSSTTQHSTTSTTSSNPTSTDSNTSSNSNGTITIRVLLFARAREVVGSKELSMTIPSTTRVSDWVTLMTSRYELLKPLLKAMVIAVNMEYVGIDSSVVLKNGDEVAFIPPISGG